MKKKVINLLIEEKDEPKLIINRLKKWLPRIAVLYTCLFFLLFLFLFIYIIRNQTTYDLLLDKNSAVSRDIEENKDTEGFYTSLVILLQSIERIKQNEPVFMVNALNDISIMGNVESKIDTAILDEAGQAKITVFSPSIFALEKIVDVLRENSDDGRFQNIMANAIGREKDGSYTMTVDFKLNKDINDNEVD